MNENIFFLFCSYLYLIYIARLTKRKNFPSRTWSDRLFSLPGPMTTEHEAVFLLNRCWPGPLRDRDQQIPATDKPFSKRVKNKTFWIWRHRWRGRRRRDLAEWLSWNAARYYSFPSLWSTVYIAMVLLGGKKKPEGRGISRPVDHHLHQAIPGSCNLPTPDPQPHAATNLSLWEARMWGRGYKSIWTRNQSPPKVASNEKGFGGEPCRRRNGFGNRHTSDWWASRCNKSCKSIQSRIGQRRDWGLVCPGEEGAGR